MATGATFTSLEKSYNLLNIIYDIKVKQCHVAWDFEQEMFTATGSTFLEESYKPGLLPGMEARDVAGAPRWTATSRTFLGAQGVLLNDQHMAVKKMKRIIE